MAVYGIENGCPIPGQGDLFFTSQMCRGHPFWSFGGIRGHPFSKTWEWMGHPFSQNGHPLNPKTLFLEGIKRNQLPLLKF